MRQFFSFLFCWAFLFCNGQDLQNNNWVFDYSGVSGLDFTSSVVSTIGQPIITPIPSGSLMPLYREGCASLSDLNGNLIMFSDGVRLWTRRQSDNTFILAASNLQGHRNSTQNVVFIPRPGHPNNYYIVTIDGVTGSQHGLFFSEIDLTNTNLPVVSVPQPLTFDETPDDPFDLGSVRTVNSSYHNLSESITTARHENGTDYWLIAHVQNAKTGFALSYQFGCNQIGVSGQHRANQVLPLTIAYSAQAPADKYFGQTLKVAPDRETIAFATGNSIRLGLFDDLSGVITFNQDIGRKSYALDFSLDSQLLYFSEENTVSILDLNNIEYPEPSYGLNTNRPGIQRGRDGLVYVHDDKDIFRFALNDFGLSQYTTDTGLSTGLPQWVYYQEPKKETGIVAYDDIIQFSECSQTVSSTTVMEKNPDLMDTYNGQPITSLSNLTLNIVGYASPTPTSGGVTIDTATGYVIVAPGTPNGSYVLQYQICDLKACVCSNVATVKVIVKGKKDHQIKFEYPTEICYKDTLPPLPDIINGVPGQWSDAPNNTQSGCYTFTPNDPCIVGLYICVTVHNSIIPEFCDLPVFCLGEPIPQLPTVSCNGITGTWDVTGNPICFNPDVLCAEKVCITLPKPTVVSFPGIPTSICAGSPLPTLPTQSGSITGVWSGWVHTGNTWCNVFNPLSGQCAVPVQVCITEQPVITPTFQFIPFEICEGEVPTLPQQSDNGINGIWHQGSSAGEWVFEPLPGQCAVSVTVNINVNPVITPIFGNLPTQVCEGETPQMPNATNVPGNWTLQSSTSTTLTYVFHSNIPCVTGVTHIVNIVPAVIPEFDLPTSICAGDTPPVLPTTSLNDITGWWDGPVDNTQTHTYHFHADPGQCAADIAWTIQVNPYVTPAFSSVPTWMCANEDPELTLPATSNQGITGTWDCEEVSGEWHCDFIAAMGQCANPVSVIIDITPMSVAVFGNLPTTICEGSVPLPLPDPISGTGYWDATEIDTQVSQCYYFTPDGDCPQIIELCVDVVPAGNYHGAVLNEYVHGDTTSGIEFWGNYPTGTTYAWEATRQNGSVQYYPPATNIIRYLTSSYTNRIVSVVVHVFYGNCEWVYEHEFPCPVPHADMYGQMFPDCAYYGRDVNVKTKEIIAHPNPATAIVYFEGADANMRVRLLDGTGKVLADGSLGNGLDVSRFSQGIYFYELYNNDELIKRGKIVKD
jgi:hypothetical protein